MAIKSGCSFEGGGKRNDKVFSPPFSIQLREGIQRPSFTERLI